MTNKQRRILEDAEVSPELMHEVDHYLKDVGAVLSGTIHEKENYLTMFCNDIAEFVAVNPSASINNIIGEFGTPEKHADVFLENKMKDKPETIRKRLVFHRVIAIAAVLVVAIVGIVYACALIENHKDANGRTADTIEYYENIEEIG